VVGLWRGTDAGLTAGSLVGFILLAYRFLEPVAEFTEVLDQTQTAVVGWRRLLGLLATPADIVDPVDPVAVPNTAPAIELRNVTFATGPDLVRRRLMSPR
jgi:ATP-binding cassette, subfamily B, bacterial